MPNAFLNCTSVLKNMALQYVKEHVLNRSINCSQTSLHQIVCVCVRAHVCLNPNCLTDLGVLLGMVLSTPSLTHNGRVDVPLRIH